MKFDDLISTIDQLDDEQIDEVVDWQMSSSPAARAEHSGHWTAEIGVGRAAATNVRTWFGALLAWPHMTIPLDRWLSEDGFAVQTYQGRALVVAALTDLRFGVFYEATGADGSAERCTQCQRYLGPIYAPDPDISRPGVLFCDECAGMQR